MNGWYVAWCVAGERVSRRFDTEGEARGWKRNLQRNGLTGAWVYEVYGL